MLEESSVMSTLCQLTFRPLAWKLLFEHLKREGRPSRLGTSETFGTPLHEIKSVGFSALQDVSGKPPKGAEEGLAVKLAVA
jgi:hypothetical protein